MFISCEFCWVSVLALLLLHRGARSVALLSSVLLAPLFGQGLSLQHLREQPLCGYQDISWY